VDQGDQGDHNPPWWTRTGFYILLMRVGSQVGSGGETHLEAKGRDHPGFVSLFPSLATSVAEASFVFRLFFPGPEPAAWT